MDTSRELVNPVNMSQKEYFQWMEESFMTAQYALALNEMRLKPKSKRAENKYHKICKEDRRSWRKRNGN